MRSIMPPGAGRALPRAAAPAPHLPAGNDNPQNPSRRLASDALALAIAVGFVYATPAPPKGAPLPAPRPASTPMLGNSSTVEQRTLTPSILVRIQVPQPILPKSLMLQSA